MYITDPNGDAKVEALLAGWEIGPSGQLVKQKEVRFKYNRPYLQSHHTHMRLQLSQDKKYVLLPVEKEIHSHEHNQTDDPTNAADFDLDRSHKSDK